MNAKDLQVMTVSVVVSLLLGTGLYYFLHKPAVSETAQVKILAGPANGSDDPIIMAGGSLHIATSLPLTFEFDNQTTPTKLQYSNPMQVRSIDGFQVSNNRLVPISPIAVAHGATGASGSVAMTYCKGGSSSCNSGTTDTVTLSWDNAKDFAADAAGTPSVLTITNSDPNTSIGNFSRLLPNLRTHPRKHWDLSKGTISVSGDPHSPYTIDCGKVSECNVVIHTCTAASTETTCVPSN